MYPQYKYNTAGKKRRKTETPALCHSWKCTVPWYSFIPNRQSSEKTFKCSLPTGFSLNYRTFCSLEATEKNYWIWYMVGPTNVKIVSISIRFGGLKIIVATEFVNSQKPWIYFIKMERRVVWFPPKHHDPSLFITVTGPSRVHVSTTFNMEIQQPLLSSPIVWIRMILWLAFKL